MLSSPLEFSLSFKFHKALLLLFWTVITLNFTHIFTLSSSTIHFLLHYCGIIFLLKKLFNISYVGLLDTIYISFCVSKNVFVFPSFLNISAVYKILDLELFMLKMSFHFLVFIVLLEKSAYDIVEVWIFFLTLRFPFYPLFSAFLLIFS